MLADTMRMMGIWKVGLSLEYISTACQLRSVKEGELLLKYSIDKQDLDC